MLFQTDTFFTQTNERYNNFIVKRPSNPQMKATKVLKKTLRNLAES